MEPKETKITAIITVAFIIILIGVIIAAIVGKKSTSTVQAWPEAHVQKAALSEADMSFTPKLMPMFQETRSTKAAVEKFTKASAGRTSNYDIVKAQPPVKSQGPRGQCHNFATTGAMEYSVFRMKNVAYDFSEQCNAWKFYLDPACKCSGDPTSQNDGGYVDCEVKCIKGGFMKYEKDYPYQYQSINLCKEDYNKTPYYQFADIVSQNIGLSDVKAAIDSQFVVVTSTNWRGDKWNEYGEFPYYTSYATCTTSTCGGHAIIIVAYDDNYYGPGLGGYIFKNSWGYWWSKAKGSKPEGYGVFPYTYLQKYGWGYTAVGPKSFAPPSQGCGK